MRLVLKMIAVPLEVIATLVRADRVFEFQREGDGTFTAVTVPLNPTELAAVARELMMLEQPQPLADADTEIIPRVGRDPVVRSNGRGELYAFCPDHPLWEPLDRDLRCTADSNGTEPRCPYQATDPPGARYANR